MNTSSLLKMGFFDKIATFFDIIPKIIYFLSATLLSGIDILHCMIRKLAGLDVYYVEGTPHAQQDPLSEFIYGILGIGESAPLYKGLNTVFWSLAIFGIICLIVTTMIAIIKSHYNEDTAGTSPMKYIYTAVKAVLTFAVIPFVVVFGINLASFALKTLDQITAGTATSEDIKNLYGEAGLEEFKGGYLEGQEGTGTMYYSRYDFFGFGAYTSSTTFSGMLFKACAYDANRARGGDDEAIAGYGSIETTGGNKIFEHAADETDGTPNEGRDDEEAANKLADAFDFAFANNLNMKSTIYVGNLVDSIGGWCVPYWEVTDILQFVQWSGSFSKYDTSLIWWFYNLWKYNFIVAFGGGITMFGIFLSIIIGLFSRLIKGAALFLVYPATLGLAPLDNFKAFKSWGQQFMQQVLMAFGAILGVNLVLLIMPYVQNIQFFKIGLLNYMINVVIVMTAMIMTKDFIGIVSGFVGGADALTTGSGMKGELGNALKTGIKATAFAGRTAFGVMKATSIPNIVHGAIRGVKSRSKKKQEYKQQEDEYLRSKGIDPTTNGPEAKKARAEFKKNYESDGRVQQYNDLKNEETAVLGGGTREDLEAKVNADKLKIGQVENSKEFQNIYKRAMLSGKTHEEAMEEARSKIEDQNVGYKNARSRLSKNQTRLDRYDEIQEEKKKALGTGYVVNKSGDIVKQGFFSKLFLGTAKEGKKEGGILNFAGKVTGVWDRSTMSAAGKEIADGFVKGIREMGSGTGLSGLFKGAKGLIGETFTMKGGVFDKDPKKSGDDLTKSVAEKSEAANKERHNTQVEILKGIKEAIEEMSKKLPGSGESS